MLFPGKLQVPAHKHEHPSGRPRRLAIDSGDVMLALLERQAVELGADVLSSQDLLSLERQHGALVIQRNECLPVGVELRVVVLHEGLGQAIGIHSSKRKALPVGL